jgi:hypothetical protein
VTRSEDGNGRCCQDRRDLIALLARCGDCLPTVLLQQQACQEAAALLAFGASTAPRKSVSSWKLNDER